MKTTTVGADEVIQQIVACLLEADGDFIEQIANRVITHKVKYLGDNLFEMDE